MLGRMGRNARKTGWRPDKDNDDDDELGKKDTKSKKKNRRKARNPYEHTDPLGSDAETPSGQASATPKSPVEGDREDAQAQEDVEAEAEDTPQRKLKVRAPVVIATSHGSGVAYVVVHKSSLSCIFFSYFPNPQLSSSSLLAPNFTHGVYHTPLMEYQGKKAKEARRAQKAAQTPEVEVVSDDNLAVLYSLVLEHSARACSVQSLWR